MQFRWTALLTLWTLLSGPMLAVPVKQTRTSLGPPTVEAQSASAPRTADRWTVSAERWQRSHGHGKR